MGIKPQEGVMQITGAPGVDSSQRGIALGVMADIALGPPGLGVV